MSLLIILGIDALLLGICAVAIVLAYKRDRALARARERARW